MLLAYEYNVLNHYNNRINYNVFNRDISIK